MPETLLVRVNIFIYLLASLLPVSVFAQVNFTTGKLSVSPYHPTSLQFGPDGKLYVSVQDGTIYRYTIQKTSTGYAVSATETILLVKQIPNHDDNGVLNTTVTSRQVTGILVTGTAANPKIYVTSSDPRIGGSGTENSSPNGDGDLNLDTNSGIVSLLSYNGSTWSKTDLVRGLPRSEENHSQNGLTLDPATNQLYVASGGSTNAGSPSIKFGMITEYALSACLLKIDLNAINSMPVLGTGNNKYVYDLPTLDDPTRTNTGSLDANDPFGGNDGRNQAKIVQGGPVQVFAPGYRNIYDVVLTRSAGVAGRLYAVDNGANQSWGGYPDKEGTPQVTNNYVTGEPGSLGPGVNDAQVNNLDNLHLLYKPGINPVYGGHPTPIRANPAGAGLFWKDGTGNHFELNPTTDWPPVPIGMANPVEADFRNAGVNDGALTTFYSSTNGIAEYTATSIFGGEMTGNLVAVSFDGAVYRMQMSADGNSVSSKTVLATGFGSVPLDITAQGDNEIFPGTLWVVDYVGNSIHYFDPVNSVNGVTWATVTPANNIFPEKRHENAFVELNGKLYLLGGRGTKPVNVFDPLTKTWTTAAPVPNGKELHHFQAVALNNKIYIINAFTGAYPSETPVPDIYIYDATTNTWTVKANAIPVSRRRGSGATAVYNNKIYIAGGITNGHNNGAVNWTDVYDPVTNVWTTLANAPHARDHVQGAIINGKLYLAGGRRTNASAGVIFTDTEATVDVYDIATNVWTTLPSTANLPVLRAGAATLHFNGKLVVIGGESAQSTAHNQVHELDPSLNTWKSLPSLVTGRHGTQAAIHNGSIYIAAGSSQQGGSASTELNSIESYPNAATGCSGNNTSTTLDDDQDGYSNKDETDNQTDPCSAASKPKDNDADKVSNLNDPDDDNDGIPDIGDAFHIDNQNGKNKYPPFAYPFLNGDPGTGLFGMGFTGLMSNGVTDPDKLYSETANGLIMGGAVGLATIPATSGSPMANNQMQAFQFGFFLNSSSPVTTVESSHVYPFFDGDNPSLLKNELHGFYIGSGDQDNYVLVAITPNYGNPAIAVIKETGGVVSENLYPIAGLLNANVQLYLEIDPAAGTIQPKYKTSSTATPVNIGTKVALSGKLLTDLQGPNAVAAGLLATARSGNAFSATWDYMNVSTATAPPTSGSKYINTGGPAVSAGGVNWSADGSFTDANPSYPSKTFSTTQPISNTPMPAIYQTERFGQAFTYNIPVANGSYTVKLHFAEIYWSGTGQRLFNVNVENGQGSLSNYDILAAAGANFKAIVNSFNVTVSDGNMTIAFTAIKDMAKISAIEIVPAAPAPSKPVANAGPDKSITLPTNSVVLEGSGTDADGTVTAYQWTQVSGPGTAGFSSSTVPNPTIGNLVAGTYVFSLTVKDNAGLLSDPDEVTVIVNSATSTNGTVRINSGGPALTVNGISWMADTYWADANSSYPSSLYTSAVAIANTEADAVYQTERFGKGYTYTIPVPNGSYEVRLHFAELFWNNKGQRVMNVNVENGQGTLNNFDILGEVAKNTALVKTFTVNVSDGNVTVQLSTVIDNAKVSGIEIVPATTTPPPPPPPSGSSLRINSGGPALSVNGESWIADKYFSTDVSSTYSSTASIANTSNPEMYRTERFGKTFSYNIPVTPGSYEVKLHFAELYWSNVGARVFNVNVENGQGTLNNFDIYAIAGKNNAVVRNFIVNASDGSVNIAFTTLTDNAKISGIEILPSTNTGSPIPDTVEEQGGLLVNISPNPSTNEFNVSFLTKEKTPLQLRVINSGGATMDIWDSVDPQSSIRLGGRYARGTYYIEAKQGSLRVVKTIVKL
jgi:N-acetylneuraminic acid mutarotase/uncharacterized protein YodC (DUF2158 family)